MNFSQYLRLDEGNYGHDVDKKRVPTGKTVTDLDGEPMLDPVTGKPLDADGPVEDEKKVQLDWQIPSLKEDWRQTDPGHTRADEEDEDEEEEEDDGEGSKWDGADNNSTNEGRKWEAVKSRVASAADESGVTATLAGAVPAYLATGGDLGSTLATGAAVGGVALGTKLAKAYRGAKKPVNDSVEIPERDALGRLSIYMEAKKLKTTNKVKAKAKKPTPPGNNNPTPDYMQPPNMDFLTLKRKPVEPVEKEANESIEIPMRDALGRLSIYSIAEGVAHMKRQLKSKNITAAEKRKIQQRLHDKETRDRPRQLARAGDPETPLDIAVNAADRASESVTPAPKKQRVSTPDETAKNKKNAPKWVKKMSKKDRDARDANNVADAEMRAGGEGTARQSHLDEPK